MTYLSLFNGMSCGYIAASELGLPITKYYSSEIDKHAMKAAQDIHPDTIQLGDITKWQEWDIDWRTVDIVLAGSPCQGFSFAGKQLAFDDPRSKLFFVFVDILRHIQALNPKVLFLLENVRMKAEHENVISRVLNIAPIMINSALVSAQNRVRLYWTNIHTAPVGLFGDMQCHIPQPSDRGILLRDILETNVPEKYYLSDKMLNYFNTRAANFNQGKQDISAIDCNGKEDKDKAGALQARYSKGVEQYGSATFIKINTDGKPKPNQNKASCITGGSGHGAGNHSDMDLICVASRGRNPENSTSRKAGLDTEQQLEPRFDGKTNTITSVQKDNLIMQLNPSTESGGVQPYQQNRVYSTDGIVPSLLAQMSSGTHAILEINEANKTGVAKIEPGECFDFENPNSKTRRGRKMKNKSNTLMAKKTDFMYYEKTLELNERQAANHKEDTDKANTFLSTSWKGSQANGMTLVGSHRIRRLTPRECGRLQTVPEHILDTLLSSGISDTQLYRMFGNGWTVEVIKHILQHIGK